jgi:hypothetical protein
VSDSTAWLFAAMRDLGSQVKAHETCLVEITRGLDTVVAERDAVRARLAAVVEVIEQAASEWDTLDGSDPAISRGMRMAADRVAAVPVPVPPRDESLYEPES